MNITGFAGTKKIKMLATNIHQFARIKKKKRYLPFCSARRRSSSYVETSKNLNIGYH
jgi:magnesium-transporting ATPase (P-type)